MIVEIDSPPLEDLGQLTDKLTSDLDNLADQVQKNPGYHEPGRLSRMIILAESGKEGLELSQFAREIGRVYLSEEISPNSLAVVSVITDQEEFDRNSRADKAATSWHQDFITEESGLYYPRDLRRVIIPQTLGTEYVVGTLRVRDPVQLTEGNYAGKIAALNAGHIVLGNDGVLVKSEPDLEGGNIHTAKPGHVYLIPKTSVHRSPVSMPNGRIFFQLDAPRA